MALMVSEIFLNPFMRRLFVLAFIGKCILCEEFEEEKDE